ncbi:MAG: toxin-antitoxin system YwqK family antitoxin [Endomicrobia bacterium]|nr:toxin-antitoxin system YwqK family antitoxin [Endomicrobiia bacterium]MCL2506872.1 toxin-antitoxin system YwqK family antitoxin [Endomicrobiia bacterium]
MRTNFLFLFSFCLIFVLTSCVAKAPVKNNSFDILGPNDQAAGQPIITAKKIETEKYPDGSPREYKYISPEGSFIYAVESINEKGGIRIEGKIPNGLILQYADSILVAQFNYNAGRLEGVVKEYYPNGTASSVRNYKAGHLYGPAKEYYPNGKIKEEATYRDELLFGALRKYSETGVILTSYEYYDGKLCGIAKDFYSNGKIKTETEYLNGKKEGRQREYSSNGILITENNYSADKLEGQSRRFYEGGNIQSVMNYSNGNIDGEAKIYSENNPKAPIYIDLYSNGRKTKRRAYDSEGTLIFTLNY